MGNIDELLKKGRLRQALCSVDMISKELNVGKTDLMSSQKSLDDKNYKWAIIQAYYSIFHAARAMVYKAGFREESHTALKLAFKELYVDTEIVSVQTYYTLERGMNLREMADYKENYSQSSAENLIASVSKAIEEIGKIINVAK